MSPVASSSALTLIGTLGILLIAKRRGLIQSLTQEIGYLQTRLGFASARYLKAKVLQEARE